ncbi:uncharacterized protein LOC131150604 isoform X2 [Malania oleifera]|uniref:uncharacterized protein LOC131150604 isoform X2 n=1 Tax=Malania oleifera TaxID=397392 RepID=UPI0025AE8CA7|nr:uncharacterized protein LOC131150604 isoform X2 [Malania oleifera]
MDLIGGLANPGNPSLKIISVAAGEAHTLALTGDGSVYSWGRGMFGRLGTGSESDESFPVRVRFDSSCESGREKLKFVGVAAGAYHSLALADRSETRGKAPLKICSIKAGGMMSLAIDNLGGLWIWGNCPQPASSSDGKFSLFSCSTPIPVWHFHGHTVVKVACGNEHVVALVSAGETYKGGDLICYSWGNNSHGQLGLGDTEGRLHPEVVGTFNLESPWALDEVACGAFHTALLSHIKEPGDALESVLWTFGLGENGQLGHGTNRSALLPEPIKGLPQHVFLVSIDCGLFHTSVVTSAGEVWSWGMEKGLGLCPDASFTGNDAGDAVSPRLYGSKIPGLLQVACGAAHTVLVASDGYKLWSWGRGRSGVLGNGKTVDCFAPKIVLWPPLVEDFKEEELKPTSEGKNIEDEDPKTKEMGKKLSSVMDELKLLHSKLSVLERYASILHGSIYGKPLEERDIPMSLQSLGTFDIAKEWENMLESADRGKLVRLEGFYRNMLVGVKDKLMKRRIQEIMKECLHSSTAGN